MLSCTVAFEKRSLGNRLIAREAFAVDPHPMLGATEATVVVAAADAAAVAVTESVAVAVVVAAAVARAGV